MKASHELLVKISELGIIKSIPNFLSEPLKPGRLYGLFVEVSFIADTELKKVYKNDANFFYDNKEEISAYLEKFSKIMNPGAKEKKDIHAASVVCFCLGFLKDTKTIYPDKLVTCLENILDYFERVGDKDYDDFLEGKSFWEEWGRLSNG